MLETLVVLPDALVVLPCVVDVPLETLVVLPDALVVLPCIVDVPLVVLVASWVVLPDNVAELLETFATTMVSIVFSVRILEMNNVRHMANASINHVRNRILLFGHTIRQGAALSFSSRNNYTSFVVVPPYRRWTNTRVFPLSGPVSLESDC